MEAILRPWAARADALYPQWRPLVHRGDCQYLEPVRKAFVLVTAPLTRRFNHLALLGNVPEIRPLDDSQQRQLREVLEVFSLGLSVDTQAVIRLAWEGQENARPLSTDGADPQVLSIAIQAQLTRQSPANIAFYKPFFADWSERSASVAFQDTKYAIEELQSQGRRRKPPFELTLDLTLGSDHSNCRDPRLALAPMLQLLESIDRHVFKVVKVKLSILHVVYKLDELRTLFQRLHTFRSDAAVVHILLELDHNPSLGRWKPIFDLVARTAFPEIAQPSPKPPWEIEVASRGPNRLVAACCSALANAGEHVTSIRLPDALEDTTSYQASRGDRDIRAKWLGYLLRAGVVGNLTFTEEVLTSADVDSIASIIEAPSPENA